MGIETAAPAASAAFFRRGPASSWFTVLMAMALFVGGAACMGRVGRVVSDPSSSPVAGSTERRAVIEVAEGERLELADMVIEAGEDQVAILVRGSLRANAIEVRGGAVGIRIEGGTVKLEDVEITGSRQGIELRGGVLEASDLRLGEIGASAIFVAEGRLEARSVEIDGADHGLLARPEADLDVSRLRVNRARMAAVALTGASARFDSVSVEGPSLHGALIANDLLVPLSISRMTLTDVGPVGLSLVRAPAVVNGLSIDGVTAARGGEEGHCVLVVGASLELDGFSLAGCSGEAVAAIRGAVLLRGGAIARFGPAGVMAWDGSEVRVEEVRIEDGEGVAIASMEGSSVVMVAGGAHRNREGRAIADCSSGSKVVLEGVAGDRGEPTSCVEELASTDPP